VRVWPRVARYFCNIRILAVDWRRAIKPNQRVALLPAAGAACERRDGLKYSRPKTFLFYNKCYSLFEGHR
jgi:hypothetical protein